MNQSFERLPPEERRKLRKLGDTPAWISPMLAVLTEDRFSHPSWIYEPKLDGERCLGFRRAGGVELFSRNRKRLTASYPEVAEAMAGPTLPDLVVDGEIVAFGDGVPSLARLQPRMQTRDPEAARRSGVSVSYYVFDLLHHDGYDTTALALRQRKGLLSEALTFDDPVRYTPHRDGEGIPTSQRCAARGGRASSPRAATPRMSAGALLTG